MVAPSPSRPPLALVVVALVGLLLVGGVALAMSRPAGSAVAPSRSSTVLPATGAGAPVSSAHPSAGIASPTPEPSIGSAFLPGGLLIADRGNGRILAVSATGAILWRFPTSAASLPKGQQFSADDAFIDPSGKTIMANDEFHNVIDRIDIATGRIVWQYGTYGRAGAGPGQLHTPDDAYPLANGDIVVADIFNCRVLEIAPSKAIVRQWGKTGDCRHRAGVTFAQPNGDTPLPDGGLLVTEILGSRVVRLAADGSVVFDIKVPVAYPSDAQLDENGNVVVADFSTKGQVVAVDPTGKLVWRYGPATGPGALNHPSLATPLPGGLVSINDDFRHRMIVIDPGTGKIVWQYGHTDSQSKADGSLNTPDGHEPLPSGAFQ